jgi:nitroreductase/dihydropteridine reductase
MRVLVVFLILSCVVESVMAFHLVNSLLWRSAVKTFKPVPKGSVDISPVLESIRLAPSSFGIQPYHVHVVTNTELKKRLREVSYDQPQV